MIGQFFDTMIVVINNDTSKSKSWNVLETVLSHLKTLPGCRAFTHSVQASFEYRSQIKAAAWTNGNVHFISSKLNSAFSSIGKATAHKIAAELVGKTHAFAFA